MMIEYDQPRWRTPLTNQHVHPPRNMHTVGLLVLLNLRPERTSRLQKRARAGKSAKTLGSNRTSRSPRLPDSAPPAVPAQILGKSGLMNDQEL